MRFLALLRAKMPYFVTLLLIAMCASYLYHGFFLRDILINVVVCAYFLLFPHTIFLQGKSDRYDILSSMPSYLYVAIIAFIAFTITNHFRITSLSFISVISIVILMVLSIWIADIARYN